ITISILTNYNRLAISKEAMELTCPLDPQTDSSLNKKLICFLEKIWKIKHPQPKFQGKCEIRKVVTYIMQRIRTNPNCFFAKLQLCVCGKRHLQSACQPLIENLHSSYLLWWVPRDSYGHRTSNLGVVAIAFRNPPVCLIHAGCSRRLRLA